MEDLFRLYGEQVHVLNIYTLEAHPVDDRPLRYSYDAEGNQIEQPESYAERVELAQKTIRDVKLSLPVLVDEIDNPVYCSYGHRPNNAYLVGMDGIVVYYQEWSSPPEMEAAVLEYFSQ
jgi:hypothetical protein